MFHRLSQGQLNQMNKTHHRRTREGAVDLQLDMSCKEFPSLDGKLLSALHLYSKIFFTLPQHEFHLYGAHYRFCMGILKPLFPFCFLIPIHLTRGLASVKPLYSATDIKDRSQVYCTAPLRCVTDTTTTTLITFPHLTPRARLQTC